jgi:hypothetical protein
LGKGHHIEHNQVHQRDEHQNAEPGAKSGLLEDEPVGNDRDKNPDRKEGKQEYWEEEGKVRVKDAVWQHRQFSGKGLPASLPLSGRPGKQECHALRQISEQGSMG